MKKKPHAGGHDNSERWLLTYADLITLLLGLFVILYAMSKIDAGKYAEIVNALGGVFGTSKGIMVGNQGVMESHIPLIQNEREKIAHELQSALHLESQKLPIAISSNERGITVHIMEELLFASGSAEIKTSSMPTLDSLARVLRTLPNDVRVEGHTDNVPINTSLYPSNWHLSVARAVSIAYYLIQEHSLKPEKVAAVGYAEYQPLVPNDSDEHRAQNRRVDIVILANNANTFLSEQQKTQQAPPADNGKKENPS
ncbi:MAG TPA: OmpA family protein [Bacteroidota bacterium]|nr:OmpA family protein [Bacteroidota bacterium]